MEGGSGLGSERRLMLRPEGRFIVVKLVGSVKHSPSRRGVSERLWENNRSICEDSDEGDAIIIVISESLSVVRDELVGVRCGLGDELHVMSTHVSGSIWVIGANGRLPESAVGENAFQVVTGEVTVFFW